MISAAIIVTYNPSQELLSVFVDGIIDQVDFVIIVDNSTNSSMSNFFLRENILIKEMKYNSGIAKAQNEGIKIAKMRNANFIFTFDQDSIVAKDYCKKMIEEYENIKRDGLNISCLGPSIGNIYSQKNKRVCEEDFIISSGSLFESEIFEQVGFYKEEWFIDLIDTEWCYRARKKGYYSYRTEYVYMDHNIGDNNYPSLLGIEVRIGSPVRQYYLIRNWIFSLKSDSFPIKYKIYIIYLLFTKVPLFSLLSPKYMRMRYMLRGFFDGILGKGGASSSSFK